MSMNKLEKINRYFKKNIAKNKVMFLYSLLIILLGIITVPKIFAELQPVKSVEILSEKLDYNKKDPGSWKIDKSAKWISKGVVEITFDLDTVMKANNKYTDIFFILDVSGSMEGEKLNKVKDDTIELIDNLLSNEKNRAALITFGKESQIVSPLTNNKKELIDYVNNLNIDDTTNYYQALVNLANLLKKYKKENDRECIALFLTDGYPNEDTPNEITQYEYIKNAYPFATINGVQYEMGSSILEPIKNVTDNQFIADMETLNNVLFDASLSPEPYKDFEITDYIDTNYFYVEAEKDIKATQGNITFNKNEQKITWKIDDLKSGTKAKMKITAKLKDELIGEKEIYSTNSKEKIKSEIKESNEDVESSKTPVLVDNYKVSYDANEPSGCRVNNVPTTKKYSVFDTVAISDNIPTCGDYQFKGWKIVTNNVQKINNDYFIMPENDVKIVGNWSKINVKKSMNGKINERITLYKQVQQDAYQDRNIYYYYSSEKNNVIFGGFCWRMYMTTETGGVKMLYNGEPDSEGKCGADRGDHVGYIDKTARGLSSDYSYGTEYIYDDTTKTFNISGSIEEATWSDSTYQNLIGKYTCANKNGICSTLYYIDSYYSNTAANVYPINNSTDYAVIGTSMFNKESSEINDVGYMYNRLYPSKNKLSNYSYEYLLYESDINNSYYFADSYEWGKQNFERYNLVNPYQNNTTINPQDLVGKYTLRSSKESITSSTIYYVIAVTDSKIYYATLENNEDISNINKKYYFSDSLVEDASGNQMLNPSTLEEVASNDWYLKYKNYNNKYFCKTADCSTIYYVSSTSDISLTYIDIANKYMFGNSFTYDTEKDEYTLSGETQQLYEWPNAEETLKNTHYTCWNTSGKCQKISYIYHVYYGLHYIDIEKGKNVETALDEIMHVNEIDSEIKNMIDLWYSKNMLLYTDYLEDAVWCNDRNLNHLNTSGWNPNGGNIAETFGFSNDYCDNEADRFTVSKENGNGNGALTYPVGLITHHERYISSNAIASGKANSYQWTMTPNKYIPRLYAYNYRMTNNGSWIMNDSRDYVTLPNGVRPAIVLRPDIEFSKGNGNYDNPFIIDLSNDEYKISIVGNYDVKINRTYAIKGEKIRIIPNSSSYDVESFKMNGNIITGDKFTMPDGEAKITDIVLKKHIS